VSVRDGAGHVTRVVRSFGAAAVQP
jgi:hypothetical protein